MSFEVGPRGAIAVVLDRSGLAVIGSLAAHRVFDVEESTPDFGNAIARWVYRRSTVTGFGDHGNERDRGSE